MVKKILSVILICVICLFQIAWFSHAMAWVDYMKGRRLIEQRLYREAIQRFEILTYAYGHTIWADKGQFLSAKIYYEKLHSPNEAIIVFKKHMENFPRSPRYKKSRAYIIKIMAELNPSGNTAPQPSAEPIGAAKN